MESPVTLFSYSLAFSRTWGISCEYVLVNNKNKLIQKYKIILDYNS